MRAADIMSSRVISVTPTAPVRTAIRVMLLNRVSGLPVIDEAGQLAGIVSEGDFLRRGEIGTERRRPDWLEFLIGPGRLADEYVHTHGRRVADVMTSDVVTVGPESPLADIADLMERKRIKQLPVVEKGRVIGMVTRNNLLQGIVALNTGAQKPADDELLRTRVLSEIHRLPWTPWASLNVVVHNGAAHLWGTILDERQRRAMCVAA